MSLLSWITGFDKENAQRAAEADAKLRELNQARYGVDYVNRDDYVSIQTAEQQIGGAFVEGWQDGRNNIRTGIGATINGLFKNTFGLIPWQIWLLAAAAGVVYFWPVIRPVAGRLAKRIA